jgi:hypothetical protein
MSSLALPLLALMVTGLLAGPALRDQEETSRGPVALAEEVQRTKDSLIRGLSASACCGEPIAVTFELRQGRLQLSVCTVWNETFWNVMVEPATWKVVAVEPITNGDALAAAHAQRAAMARAK